ncbi:nitroreductase family protein, partial [Shewanella frigidimarina]
MKTLLRKLLPSNAKQRLRIFLVAVDEFLLTLLSYLFEYFPRGCTWFYSLVSRDFMREQQAVLSGRLAYRNKEG